MAVLRALGEIAVLTLPCVSMASPLVVPPALSVGYWFRATIITIPRAALAYTGAVRAARLVAVRPCSEPVTRTAGIAV